MYAEHGVNSFVLAAEELLGEAERPVCIDLRADSAFAGGSGIRCECLMKCCGHERT